MQFEELVAAQLLWVDRLGMYLFIQVRNAVPNHYCAAASLCALLADARA